MGGYVSLSQGQLGSWEDEPCLGQVSHALALHRGIVAVPSGQTKIDTRENPFTQVEGRSDMSDGIFCGIFVGVKCS